jgi:hypothetical protein
MPWLTTQPSQDSAGMQMNANNMVAMQAQVAMQLQQRAYLANLQSALMAAAFHQTMSTAQATVAPPLTSSMPFGPFGMGFQAPLPQASALQAPNFLNFPGAPPSPQRKPALVTAGVVPPAPSMASAMAAMAALQTPAATAPNASNAAAFWSLLAASREAQQVAKATSPSLPTAPKQG